LTAGSFAYYVLPLNRVVISPNIGILYEHTEQSALLNSKIDLTGGKVLQGSVGSEISFKSMSMGLSVQLPLAQNFAQNQTKEKVKGMIHVSFAL
jgi:hypothetical protein